MEYFVKDTGKNQVVYKSLLIENPKLLGILANKTALDLVKELSLKPLCAMDLARRLGLHEQKVYYNLRKLEKSGIIKLLKTEERTGGTAKIFTLAEPVISVKLAEQTFLTTNAKVSIKHLDFLKPFIVDGKLNAKIILGSPYPHGKYGATPRDLCYAVDLALYLGSLVSDFKPGFILDTDVKEKDLKSNLILVGGPKINMITDRINKQLPIQFKTDHEFEIVSSLTNKVYTYDYDSVIIRMKNPFDNEKEIIVLAGKRSAGTQSAVIAFTQHLDEIMKGSDKNKKTARVVTGTDKDSDGIIDSVKFLE